MKLVIDIPDHIYEHAKNMSEDSNDEYDAMRAIAKGKKAGSQWIPCSERFPEKQGQYYVSGGDMVWICDFLIFSNFKGGWCNNVSNPIVEAWMPLPEPYKGE